MIDTLRHVVLGGDYTTESGLTLYNRTVAEIAAFGEEKYLGLVQLLLCQAHDMMSVLADMGLDYEKIDPLVFFYMNLKGVEAEALSFLVDMPAPASLFLAEDTELGRPAILARDTDFVLTWEGLRELREAVGALNHMPPTEQPNYANAITKEFLLDKQRRKLRRAKDKPFVSQLAGIISGLVNSAGFKYDYQTVLKLHISQLFDAIYRVGRIADFTFTMGAVYGGTIEFDKIDKSVLNWTE